MRSAGQSFLQRSQRWISWQHQKVLLAITRCGPLRWVAIATAVPAAGIPPSRTTHVVTATVLSARARRQHWLEARERELLPTPYVHIVFTVPRDVASLALQNSGVHCSTPALRHLRSLVIPGSWCRDRFLQRAPHLESAFAASSSYSLRACCRRARSRPIPLDRLATLFLSPHQSASSRLPREVRRWIKDGSARADSSSMTTCPAVSTPSLRILASAAVPSRLGRVRQTAIRWAGSCSTLSRQLHHRVAISNHRLVALTNQDVTFRWRDSAHKKRRMTLPVDEFLRRFLLHLLPRGFVRIRHFGFLANDSVLCCCRSASACFRIPRASRLSPSLFTSSPSLQLEVSCVRRYHACSRATLGSSTPAPFPA